MNTKPTKQKPTSIDCKYSISISVHNLITLSPPLTADIVSINKNNLVIIALLEPCLAFSKSVELSSYILHYFKQYDNAKISKLKHSIWLVFRNTD